LRRKVQIGHDLEGRRRRWEKERMKGLNCKTIVKACFPHFMCFTFLVDTLTGSDPNRSVTTSQHIQWR
jgi:hypothetical protein